MHRLMHHAAMEARALLILLDALDFELGMRQRPVQHDAGDMGRGPRRPVLAAGEAAGEDEHVVGEVRHGKGRGAEIVERGRGAERGDDPALSLIAWRAARR